MVGRVATVVGPLLVGLAAVATGSSRASILVVLVLFAGGGILLLFVDEKGAEEAARASHVPVQRP
jgi:UMF1 family MFS transporter